MDGDAVRFANGIPRSDRGAPRQSQSVMQLVPVISVPRTPHCASARMLASALDRDRHGNVLPSRTK